MSEAIKILKDLRRYIDDGYPCLEHTKKGIDEAITLLEQKPTESWTKGNMPKEAGWYLACYLSNDKPPVNCYEKLWFNPDSLEKWWFQHEEFLWQDRIIKYMKFNQACDIIEQGGKDAEVQKMP